MKKIANHPIWSKVIAGLILSFILWVIGEFRQINWTELRFENVELFFRNFPVASILSIVISALIVFVIIEFAKRIILFFKRKSQEKEFDDTSKDYYFNTGRTTTEFFSGRVGDAFPGLRGFQWITNTKKAVERLEILLREPLKFKVKSEDNNFMMGTISPIWWFSRGGSMEIDSFKVIRYPMLFGLIKGKILIGWDEFVIKKIGVYHSPARHYLDLVYVETYPDKPTGLYQKRKRKKIGRETEEYAIFNGHKIKHEEYDDGSAVIKGKVIDTYGAEIRIRNLSHYNFIICAKQSPYNTDEFDHLSMDEFDLVLTGEKSFEEIFERMKKFPRRDRL